MRKWISLLAILALGGCATFANPVTQDQLYNAENAYGIALSAAVGYRKLCVQKVPTIYPNCRKVVPELQAADRKVQGAIAAARGFIKNNPSISPLSFIGAVQQALADFQAVEAKYGVK